MALLAHFRIKGLLVAAGHQPFNFVKHWILLMIDGVASFTHLFTPWPWVSYFKPSSFIFSIPCKICKKNQKKTLQKNKFSASVQINNFQKPFTLNKWRYNWLFYQKSHLQLLEKKITNVKKKNYKCREKKLVDFRIQNWLLGSCEREIDVKLLWSWYGSIKSVGNLFFNILHH